MASFELCPGTAAPGPVRPTGAVFPGETLRGTSIPTAAAQEHLKGIAEQFADERCGLPRYGSLGSG